MSKRKPTVGDAIALLNSLTSAQRHEFWQRIFQGVDLIASDGQPRLRTQDPSRRLARQPGDLAVVLTSPSNRVEQGKVSAETAARVMVIDGSELAGIVASMLPSLSELLKPFFLDACAITHRARNPQVRNAERDDQIICLYDRPDNRLSFTQIGRKLPSLNRAWVGRDGRPLSGQAIKQAYHQRKAWLRSHGGP
jgi:hypothetical protein